MNMFGPKHEHIFEKHEHVFRQTSHHQIQDLSRKFGIMQKNTYICTRKHGKVLYGMLPRNPPGLDRSKGTWL